MRRRLRRKSPPLRHYLEQGASKSALARQFGVSRDTIHRWIEHTSTVLTSNNGLEEWGDVFGDDVMAAALIDRLVHHCHIVTIRGNSYRMRQHTDLWHALHTTQDPEPAPSRRRRARQEVATA